MCIKYFFSYISLSPYTRWRFIRIKVHIKVFIFCMSPKKTYKIPFHEKKSYHSFSKFFLSEYSIACISEFRIRIITIWTPNSSYNICFKYFSNFNIHTFCSSLHQEGIMKYKRVSYSVRTSVLVHGCIVIIFLKNYNIFSIKCDNNLNYTPFSIQSGCIFFTLFYAKKF